MFSVPRLMLILQSFNVHAELLLGNQRPSSSGQNGAPVSIGPVVKLYWKNLLELSNQYVQRVRRSVNIYYQILIFSVKYLLYNILPACSETNIINYILMVIQLCVHLETC